MTSDLARGSPPSLLRTPQRLGILPTWQFWNRERQQVLMPLSLVTAIPLGLLYFFVTRHMGSLGFWLSTLIYFVVYPTLLLGLVERHIRRQLLRRVAAVDVDVPELDERGEQRAAEDSQRAMCHESRTVRRA